MYQLGTIEASEQLIKDVYLNLREELKKWSIITRQTSQARMGYIGQHLTSVVTGFPGGKSGARGKDIVFPNGKYGEIKTCYRVDQLGKCLDCKEGVSPLETECEHCGSKNIQRNDDSKWLISIRNDDEFKILLEPDVYYLVLFEFEDINSLTNKNIVASIWEVNSKFEGFAFCMIDYYLNIRSQSTSKAPFNLWPYQLKFYLMNPRLIYRSIITEDNNIKTYVFPNQNDKIETLPSIDVFSRSTNLTDNVCIKILQYFRYVGRIPNTKIEKLRLIESIKVQNNIDNKTMCSIVSHAIYIDDIVSKKYYIPAEIKKYFPILY